jgi:LysM repeat protein
VGSRPSSYTLQKGEFPYCIARRFDVNPQELLSLNGLSSAEANSLAVGKVLSIPQRGSFPPPRARAAHPATYTVKSSAETIYGVACQYGDIDPSAIAQANNLSLNSALTVGQSLQIP